MGVKITAVGSYLPSKIVTNDQLSQTVDTSDEWIRARTGIATRHIVEAGESTSTMAAQAARAVLLQRGIGAEEIDLIVVSTMTGDYPTISVACQVQALIGATRAAAFDIMLACSGYNAALITAANFIKTGMAKKALVIGSETLSSITDWTDRTTCVLFGDGAGAVLLEESAEDHFLASKMRADGNKVDLLMVPAGGAVQPATPESVQERQHFVKMKGSALFEAVVPLLVEQIDDVCEQAGVDIEDIDHFILHQANIHFLEAVGDVLEIPKEKFVVTIDEHANTSSASIPLALDEHCKQGRFKAGDLMLFLGFGGGLASTALLLRWSGVPGSM